MFFHYGLEVKAYIQNFGPRVDSASVKNFQLIDSYDDQHIYMQFGKIGDNKYNLDVAYPCSIFQAFAIALASLDFKISSE